MSVSLALAGVGVLAGALAVVQMRGRSLEDIEGDIVSSPCLTDATVQLVASPATVLLGQKSVISWSVGLPGRCSGVKIRLNGESVSRAGSRSVWPSRTTSYMIRVTETRLGVVGSRSDSTRVEVSYPSRVAIEPDTPNPVDLLIGALVDSNNPKQTVVLGCVELDLTGRFIDIRQNHRSLIASPDCVRGPRRLGPRLFVTDKGRRGALFTVYADHILFSGFRLQGPTNGIGQGEENKEKAILISPADSPDRIESIVVSNMEIFEWSGVAVQVNDNVSQAERGRLFNTNVGAVHIVDNYLHHNQHGAGDGYGTNSSAGAYALIERNVFEANRHAIAGGSKNLDNNRDHSGYTARNNLILSGGGVHCSEFFLFALLRWRFNCWQTHQIDMHGDENRFYTDSNWQCGTAGETILIERNTVLYTSGLAIKIRGNPTDKAVVAGNVFAHADRYAAIAQNGACGPGDNVSNPIDVRADNVYGRNPMTELGSCDFVGDGRVDQFMATGVTWWAKSPETEQWRYLNTMPERLPQLQLGNVDGDEICDVAPRGPIADIAPKTYSKSGTGPWVPVVAVDGTATRP
jgi:hypothetical protein